MVVLINLLPLLMKAIDWAFCSWNKLNFSWLFFILRYSILTNYADRLFQSWLADFGAKNYYLYHQASMQL